MQIKPDKKLLTKYWFVLLTISIIIVFVAIAIQVIVSVTDNSSSAQIGKILWIISNSIILIMWIIAIPIIKLWTKNLTYFIEDDGVTIFEGVLSKRQKNIPYRAITDFVLHRSLYARFLGIGSIHIQTAGQSITATGYEGKLSGLANWDNLHQILRNKLSNIQSNSTPTTVDQNTTKSPNDNKLELILDELKSIHRVLKNK
ncbi:MAG: PH domain-containing protein [Candidatus Marinimicrobia bacterium]|nr:PH domain-containing protein [Candidatus Neomarinimicrobiota bacterium]